jgi:hypothetical protein
VEKEDAYAEGVLLPEFPRDFVIAVELDLIWEEFPVDVDVVKSWQLALEPSYVSDCEAEGS